MTLPAPIVVAPEEVMGLAFLALPAILVGCFFAFVPAALGTFVMYNLGCGLDLLWAPVAWCSPERPAAQR